MFHDFWVELVNMEVIRDKN